MTDLKSLIRLQTWLSPAFPIGAFTYSNGLESAIDLELVIDQDTLYSWLLDLLQKGPYWNDAILLAESWRHESQREPYDDLISLAKALCLSKERYLETMAQGQAFLEASKAWLKEDGLPFIEAPLPVAVGSLSARMQIGLEETCAAYLHASLSNQIQAALRLMKLGQQGGVTLLSQLEDPILETAERASRSSLDDLGGCALLADISSMKHETMQSRIFRS